LFTRLGHQVVSDGREEAEGAQTLGELEDRLAGLMAGRAAEELLLGEPSTAGEDDLAGATELALDVAGRFGMSAAGRRRLLPTEVELALGVQSAMAVLAPATQAALDAEVSRLLDSALTRAKAMLRSSRRELVAIVDRLLTDEVLEGDELAELLPSPPASSRANGKGTANGKGGNGSASTTRAPRKRAGAAR
jgi:cell division protease FtsH